jgi:hypothetical protein
MWNHSVVALHSLLLFDVSWHGLPMRVTRPLRHPVLINLSGGQTTHLNASHESAAVHVSLRDVYLFKTGWI